VDCSFSEPESSLSVTAGCSSSVSRETSGVGGVVVGSETDTSVTSSSTTTASCDGSSTGADTVSVAFLATGLGAALADERVRFAELADDDAFEAFFSSV
jgi:hypothetical protein